MQGIIFRVKSCPHYTSVSNISFPETYFSEFVKVTIKIPINIPVAKNEFSKPTGRVFRLVKKFLSFQTLHLNIKRENISQRKRYLSSYVYISCIISQQNMKFDGRAEGLKQPQKTVFKNEKKFRKAKCKQMQRSSI